jgi:hypothetical protein
LNTTLDEIIKETPQKIENESFLDNQMLFITINKMYYISHLISKENSIAVNDNNYIEINENDIDDNYIWNNIITLFDVDNENNHKIKYYSLHTYNILISFTKQIFIYYPLQSLNQMKESSQKILFHDNTQFVSHHQYYHLNNKEMYHFDKTIDNISILFNILKNVESSKQSQKASLENKDTIYILDYNLSILLFTSYLKKLSPSNNKYNYMIGIYDYDFKINYINYNILDKNDHKIMTIFYISLTCKLFTLIPIKNDNYDKHKVTDIPSSLAVNAINIYNILKNTCTTYSNEIIHKFNNNEKWDLFKIKLNNEIVIYRRICFDDLDQLISNINTVVLNNNFVDIINNNTKTYEFLEITSDNKK